MKLKKRIKKLIKIIRIIDMNQDELSFLDKVRAALEKIRSEYAAFIQETAEKQALSDAANAELRNKIAELEAMIAQQVDPVIVQQKIDEINALSSEMDSFRADIPAEPVVDIPAPPVDTGAASDGSVTDESNQPV